MHDPLSTQRATTSPILAVFHRPSSASLLSLLTLIISLLASPQASASVVASATDSAAENAIEGVSPDELQTILATAEAPAELWVAVGNNEFGIYEPDTGEIIAYVALYESQQLAVNEVDRILTSNPAALAFTPVTGVNGSTAGVADNGVTGGGNSASQSTSGSGSSSGASSAKGMGSSSSNGSEDSEGDNSDGSGGIAELSISSSDVSASGSGVPENNDFAPLLTENPADFEDPVAAVEQFDRVSALPDNPALIPTLTAKTNDDNVLNGTSSSSQASVAVPLPGSLWLLLVAPIIAPRRRKLQPLAGT